MTLPHNRTTCAGFCALVPCHAPWCTPHNHTAKIVRWPWAATKQQPDGHKICESWGSNLTQHLKLAREDFSRSPPSIRQLHAGQLLCETTLPFRHFNKQVACCITTTRARCITANCCISTPRRRLNAKTAVAPAPQQHRINVPMLP